MCTPFLPNRTENACIFWPCVILFREKIKPFHHSPEEKQPVRMPTLYAFSADLSSCSSCHAYDPQMITMKSDRLTINDYVPFSPSAQKTSKNKAVGSPLWNMRGEIPVASSEFIVSLQFQLLFPHLPSQFQVFFTIHASCLSPHFELLSIS